jgi:DNA-binding beta-propeller fold protein YncE
MKNNFTLILFSSLIFLSINTFSQEIKQIDSVQIAAPTIFIDLGETCTTPDAMAMNKKGELFLTVPNPTSFKKYGSKIVKFDKNDQPIVWLDSLPIHPISQRVHPMGIDFGPDGNLYINDNQGFAGLENQSRLIRINIKNGKVVSTEILVEGMNFANGLKWYKNDVYISDTYLRNNESGVYAFSLIDLNSKKIIIDSLNIEKHLICKFKLKKGFENEGGADGIAFDSHGNLYAGNFGDGVISKIEFSKDRKVISQKIIVDSEGLKCCDGFYYDKSKNCIFIANFIFNSVHILDLNKNTICQIWKNNLSNGENGLLDNPCEPIIYKGSLLVVNFGTKPIKDGSEIDKWNTISKFKL